MYKNIEDHLDQITPKILCERPHNYDKSIRVNLMTNRNMGTKHVDIIISRQLLILY